MNFHIDEQDGLRIYHSNADTLKSERSAINIDTGTLRVSQDSPGKPGLMVTLYTHMLFIGHTMCVLLFITLSPFRM